MKQISSLEYIDAIKIVGASNKRIMWVHIFPNVLSSIIVLVTIFMAFAITTEAALVFLGFGDPFHTISWGIELENGYDQLNLYPEQTLIPAFTLFFLVLSINVVGDGIADALDPKLKD